MVDEDVTYRPLHTFPRCALLNTSFRQRLGCHSCVSYREDQKVSPLEYFLRRDPYHASSQIRLERAINVDFYIEILTIQRRCTVRKFQLRNIIYILNNILKEYSSNHICCRYYRIYVQNTHYQLLFPVKYFFIRYVVQKLCPFFL